MSKVSSSQSLDDLLCQLNPTLPAGAATSGRECHHQSPPNLSHILRQTVGGGYDANIGSQRSMTSAGAIAAAAGGHLAHRPEMFHPDQAGTTRYC